MDEYAFVAEAERFERADLRFFFRGEAVHGRNHRKYRDREEQHRHNSAHRLPLFHFAVSERISGRFVLTEHKHRFTERRFYRVLEFGFVEVGDDVDLRINDRAHRHCGFVRGRRDIAEAERLVVGHKLRRVAHTNEVFASTDETAHRKIEVESAVSYRKRVARSDTVRARILFGKPYPLFVGFVVLRAVRDEEMRHFGVFGDGERDRILFALALYVRVYRQIPARFGYAVDTLYRFEIGCGKTAFGHYPIVREPRFFEERVGVFLDTHPLHIEADEYPYPDRYHYYHRDELRFVLPHRPEKLLYQHNHHSTSSALIGFG